MSRTINKTQRAAVPIYLTHGMKPMCLIVAAVVLSGCGGGSGGLDDTALTNVVNTDLPTLGEASTDNAGLTQGGTDGNTFVATPPTDNNSASGENNSSVQNPADLAPEILSISLGCDIVLDAIAVVPGEQSTFSINASDESVDTLTYSITSDAPDIVQVDIDAQGQVTLTALAEGSADAPVVVTDSNGNSDSLILKIEVKS